MEELLTIVVLTWNEEKHLPRLLESCSGVGAKVCIVDSFSNDKTEEIARNAGVQFYQHTFVNHAVQFQWALDNCNITTPWVMRMDADEYLTKDLAQEINEELPKLDIEVGGIILKRQVHFMGKWIRYGGYYPIKLLRIWRNGNGSIEQRWMDEHVIIKEGRTIEFDHDIVDDNLNNLTWWTEKHNRYATREAIDLLNHNYHFILDLKDSGISGSQMRKKRWYKENLYAKSPLFIRAFGYFLYRYLFLLGFVDGPRGLVWHVLQGFWYRFLVDAKIYQVKSWAKQEGKTPKEIIEEKFQVKI